MRFQKKQIHLSNMMGFAVIAFLLLVTVTGCNPQLPDHMAKKSVPELILDTKNEVGTTRAQAAVALGLKGAQAKEAVPALIKLLSDEKAYVQNRAMEALGKIGKDAIPGLLEAVKSGNEATRFYAAHTLGKINHPKAQQAFMEWSQKEGKS